MVTGDLRFDTRRRALSSARPQAALRAWPFCDCLSADAPAQFARAELGALRGDRRPRAARAGGWWPGHEDLDIIRELGGPEAVGRPFPDIESPNPPCPMPSQLPSFNRIMSRGGGTSTSWRRWTNSSFSTRYSSPGAIGAIGTDRATSAGCIRISWNSIGAQRR
jgi:hypothetical protein